VIKHKSKIAKLRATTATHEEYFEREASVLGSNTRTPDGKGKGKRVSNIFIKTNKCMLSDYNFKKYL